MKPVTDGSRLIEPVYGRLTDDFEIGAVYHHPWEVTLDDGLLAMFAASFLDPNPLYASRRFAREKRDGRDGGPGEKHGEHQRERAGNKHLEVVNGSAW